MTAAAPSTSTARSAGLAVLAAAVVAGIVNTGISLAAQGLGADPAVFLGLMPGAYILLGVIGLVVAAFAWITIRRRAARPAALLGWLAPTVVAVSLIPNIVSGLALGWTGAVALGLMHIVVGVAGVVAFRRFLPLPR